MSKLGVHRQPPTDPFIWTLWVDYSNSVHHDREQELIYDTYSLLILLFVGIEPAASSRFQSGVLSNQTPYPLRHVLLPDNSDWIFETYISINSWDSPLHYLIRCFCTIANIAIFLIIKFFLLFIKEPGLPHHVFITVDEKRWVHAFPIGIRI